jgi:archaellum component FlaF (FlaF/FlaG flagellin family)
MKFHYEEQINDLRERVEAAEQIYANIQEANEDSWGELKKAAKTAWKEVSYARMESISRRITAVYNGRAEENSTAV